MNVIGVGGSAVLAAIVAYRTIKDAPPPQQPIPVAESAPQSRVVPMDSGESQYDPICLGLAKRIYQGFPPTAKTPENWDRLLDLAWEKDLDTLTSLTAPPSVADASPQRPAPPPSAVPRATGVVPQDPGRDEAAIVAVCQERGKTVEIVGTKIGHTFKEITLKPIGQTTCKSIRTISEDLQIALKSETAPIIETKGSGMVVQVQRSDRQFPKITDYTIPQRSGLWFPIGVDIDGTVHGVDLMDSNTPHLLVGATTGGGKTCLARHALSYLTKNNGVDKLNIAIIDPGMVDLVSFNSSLHLWNGVPVQSSPEAALELFQAAETEMRDRLQAMVGMGIVTVTDEFPQLLLWCEEFKDLVFNSAHKKVLENVVSSIAGLGRKTGIHLVLSTQRPDGSVVTPLIRSNLPARIALKVAQKEDSPIILGLPNDFRALGLLGKGDMILKTAVIDRRLQAFAP